MPWAYAIFIGMSETIQSRLSRRIEPLNDSELKAVLSTWLAASDNSLEALDRKLFALHNEKLDKLCQEVGEQAKAKGLTEAKLQQLFKEDDEAKVSA